MEGNGEGLECYCGVQQKEIIRINERIAGVVIRGSRTFRNLDILGVIENKGVDQMI